MRLLWLRRVSNPASTSQLVWAELPTHANPHALTTLRTCQSLAWGTQGEAGAGSRSGRRMWGSQLPCWPPDTACTLPGHQTGNLKVGPAANLGGPWVLCPRPHPSTVSSCSGQLRILLSFTRDLFRKSLLGQRLQKCREKDWRVSEYGRCIPYPQVGVGGSLGPKRKRRREEAKATGEILQAAPRGDTAQPLPLPGPPDAFLFWLLKFHIENCIPLAYRPINGTAPLERLQAKLLSVMCSWCGLDSHGFPGSCSDGGPCSSGPERWVNGRADCSPPDLLTSYSRAWQSADSQQTNDFIPEKTNDFIPETDSLLTLE